jgi:hypothetical protein
MGRRLGGGQGKKCDQLAGHDATHLALTVRLKAKQVLLLHTLEKRTQNANPTTGNQISRSGMCRPRIPPSLLVLGDPKVRFCLLWISVLWWTEKLRERGLDQVSK